MKRNKGLPAMAMLVVICTGLSTINAVMPPTSTNKLVPEIYYVAKNGSDNNPGTEAKPFRTVSKGITALGPGDILYVRSGIYYETLTEDFPSGDSWDNPVTIAAYPGDTVTIKPNSGPYVFLFEYCHYIIIDGFILDGANVENDVIKITWEAHHIRVQNLEIKNAPGQGILITNHGSIDSDYNEFINLNIHNNGINDLDHGIYVSTSHNLITSSTIHHNAGFGVHIYDEISENKLCSNCANYNVVNNNLIYDNAQAGDSGPGIILSSGNYNLAYNNVIWGNNGGIQIEYKSSNAEVYNNTIYANDSYGIKIGKDGVATIIRNNIVYQNGSMAISDGGDGTTQNHNLINKNPQFVDASAHDLHLQSTSPAIDTGVYLSKVPDDFDGVFRPRGSGFDLGAYETPFSIRVIDLRMDVITNTLGLTATLRWTAPLDAVTYTLRSSDVYLTEANWNDAVVIPVPFNASVPSSIEQLSTRLDYPEDAVYLALKSQNNKGNWSELSNIAFWPHQEVYLPLIIKQ